MTSNNGPPKIENAPGLVWRARLVGWEARWQARTDLGKRGFTPTVLRLWKGSVPTAAEVAFIQDRCNALQAEMLVWGRGGLPEAASFTGSVRSLIQCYETDPDSTYKKLRFRTRENYGSLTRRLVRDCGEMELHAIKARDILRWHEGWTANGHVAMAHSLVGMLRTLFGFGATILENAECERLSVVLHRMRFKMPRPRHERLTYEQANAVRTRAHFVGMHSIGLAQALQFDLMLRQRDVIGDWEPITEPGVSDVIRGNEKWLRGLRWETIDANLVLRHVTSKRQKAIEVDLHHAPMVMEELARIIKEDGALPASGPLIRYEATGFPYEAHQFRREWRMVADGVGIPRSVRNMDTRAGAISEATDAGADLEHVRHAATHSDISTTQNYSRGSVEKTAGVMKLRAAHRNKPGT
jgi:hypothetical protein